jgi:hypothetical protein
MFLQKVHVEKYPQKSTKISMSVFPRFFLFYRVFGCFSAMGVQKHHKKLCTKYSCRKKLHKIIDKKIRGNWQWVFVDFLYNKSDMDFLQQVLCDNFGLPSPRNAHWIFYRFFVRTPDNVFLQKYFCGVFELPLLNSPSQT